MKKILMLVVAVVILAAPIMTVKAAAPSVAQTTSWQTYYVNTNRLVVYRANPDSIVCFDGKAEDYNGFCVSPVAPSSQYVKRMLDESVYGR